MYQTLIWAARLSDDAGRLRPPRNAKDCKGLTDALVDGVRGDVELGRDLLRRKQLVDEAEAVDLAGGKLSDALGHQVGRARIEALTRRTMRSVRIVQSNTHPAQHAALSEHESAMNLSYLPPISQFVAEITPF
jgi:hypothetical protein